MVVPIKAQGLDSFLYSPSIDGMYHRLKKTKRMKKIDSKCQKQLRELSFPESCFLSLRSRLLEMGSGKEWQRQWLKVSQVCVLSAEQIQQLDKIEVWQQEEMLSKSCREALQIRKLDLEYIQNS